MSSSVEEVDFLVRGSLAMGLQLSQESAARLIRYLDQLYLWNRSVALTTVTRPAALRLHLLDSLAVVPLLAASTTIADLGSGAGLPGVPIAVACPSLRVVLVESRRKKCTFLLEVVRLLALKNCSVVESDVGSLREYDDTFDAVVARAFLPPRLLLDVGKRLVRTGGRIVIMAARRVDELDALDRDDPSVARVEDRSFRLFGGDEERRIVVFRKLGSPHIR